MEASVPPTQIRLDLPQQQAKQRTIGRTKRKVQRLLQIPAPGGYGEAAYGNARKSVHASDDSPDCAIHTPSGIRH